jgi:hypothetical protein
VVTTAEQLTALIHEAVQDALGEREGSQEPLLLERNGIARALGVGISTVDRLRKAGMPSICIGDSPRFLIQECLAWLQENRRSETSEDA